MPASASRAKRGAGVGGQLARMVGVDRDPGRGALGLQRGDQIGGDPLRRDHRHAGVEAHDLDVIDGRERGQSAPARRRGEAISGSPPETITSQISGWARI